MVNFVAGIFLFIIIRESLPQEKEGKPLLFVLGILVYAAMMLLFN
jgi:zinc transporter ZupT